MTPAASATVEATGSADSTASAAGKGGSGKRPGISARDAKAIDAELSAIEKELDGLALPSDSDLAGIESGLK